MLGSPGWWNRWVVVIGVMASYGVLYTPWWVKLIYAVVWSLIFQMNLGIVYHRGADHAHREMYEHMTGIKGDEIAQSVEMFVNSKMVALQDLKDIGMRYGIPAEELQSIVDRGF